MKFILMKMPFQPKMLSPDYHNSIIDDKGTEWFMAWHHDNSDYLYFLEQNGKIHTLRVYEDNFVSLYKKVTICEDYLR